MICIFWENDALAPVPTASQELYKNLDSFTKLVLGKFPVQLFFHSTSEIVAGNIHSLYLKNFYKQHFTETEISSFFLHKSIYNICKNIIRENVYRGSSIKWSWRLFNFEDLKCGDYFNVRRANQMKFQNFIILSF